MPANAIHPSSPYARFGRLFALVLFLAAHISAATLARTATAADTPLAALHAAMVLCVGEKHSAPDRPAPVHHHIADPALAAQCSDAMQPAALLQSDGTLLAPSHRPIRWAVLPPACAPPVRFTGFATPTGPPTA
jgi:hypothetical protein